MKIKKNGQFYIKDIDELSGSYMPLCNPYGQKSSISPGMGGDMTIDQNHFLLVPSTAQDLDQSLFKRSMYFRVNKDYTWSTSGLTPHQVLHKDQVDMHGSFLMQKITRTNQDFTCEIESFVPVGESYKELHKVSIKNTSLNDLKIKPVLGIPLYSRSADSVRDHRHVTALLNEVTMEEKGVINTPTFSFDERGHVRNKTSYGVFAEIDGESITEYYPTFEEFCGEGHSLLDPLALKEERASYQVGDKVSGYEAMGGLGYKERSLGAGQTLEIVFSLEISEDKESLLKYAKDLSVSYFNEEKHRMQNYWKEAMSSLVMHLGDEEESGWMKWVTLQPTFRRIYGNSFMPHHDYGRGGKGWRDLWQDLLALILMNPSSVRDSLINNFKGVRIDGSNATIIGEKPGEFLADRNNIARVWMDHGAWPYLTSKLYLDKTGDIDLLFEEVPYFCDQFTHYTKKVRPSKKDETNVLLTKEGLPYQGSVLEHLLVQNIVPYYNLGEHGNIRLEDADWNDGLDMASERGESVAFTAFYGGNLQALSSLLDSVKRLGVKEISLAQELVFLLQENRDRNVQEKQERLHEYFTMVEDSVSGKKVNIKVNKLSETLHAMGQELLDQVREHEWLEDGEDGWFNGYYDNDGQALDDVQKKDMTLTGQVFALMFGAASDAQSRKVLSSADKYLYDPSVGGYRLNTDYKEVKTNMGRLFGFAYGHKENGAMFSHMALMYANALYQRNYVKEGYKVLASIYQHSRDLHKAKIYPGIPEYFDQRGRGMYHYLTGSASWMVLTYVTEVFGVKGNLGEVILEPKLMKDQFDQTGRASIETLIHSDLVQIIYENNNDLDYGSYKISSYYLDEEHVILEEPRSFLRFEQVNAKTIRIILS